jgi:hypothetical protein
MIIFTSVDFAGIGATIKVGEGATMKNNLPQQQKRRIISPEHEQDPYASTISANEFIKEIKAIQQSSDPQDVSLRNAAASYMKNIQYA